MDALINPLRSNSMAACVHGFGRSAVSPSGTISARTPSRVTSISAIDPRRVDLWCGKIGLPESSSSVESRYSSRS